MFYDCGLAVVPRSKPQCFSRAVIDEKYIGYVTSKQALSNTGEIPFSSFIFLMEGLRYLFQDDAGIRVPPPISAMM
jgi:hypothetical protein